MSFIANQLYFVTKPDVVLMKKPNTSSTSDALNHLILGDYAKCLGEEIEDWVKVRSRGNNGWLPKSSLGEKRLLEVNFVDIGQGDGCHIVTPNDEIILIDAGDGLGFNGKSGDNMFRFLKWRYNLRNRKVAGVDGVVSTDVDVKPPLAIDYAIITHPDLDHYYGFHSIFSSKKIKIKKIGHNGIVERPKKSTDNSTWFKDLGEKVKVAGKTYLWDTVRTDQDMKDLLKENPDTKKFYLKTLNQAFKQNPAVEFHFVQKNDKYFGSYRGRNPLKMEVLAPISESVTHDGITQDCLIRLGNESITKNGHSIVFKLYYGKLKLLLGGDLNSKSQDYLAQYYSKESTKLSKLESDLAKINEKLHYSEKITSKKRRKLNYQREEKEILLNLIVSKTKKFFHADIAKACHHGSSDVLDSFLKTINPIATIISSGDQESHSHPRPDALGAFGRVGRGKRPLIFSTELARSSKEFSYPIKFYTIMQKIEKAINEAITEEEREHYQNRWNSMRESNVAKYGMITVRSDGEQVIIAQKLEKKKSNAKKWDIYRLKWNIRTEEFEYVSNY